MDHPASCTFCNSVKEGAEILEETSKVGFKWKRKIFVHRYLCKAVYEITVFEANNGKTSSKKWVKICGGKLVE